MTSADLTLPTPGANPLLAVIWRGKRLSKNEKAQKLALQHWLETIDPRDCYGHNLYFYYNCRLRCEIKHPFFYWLDVGEGKEVSLDEKCPRSKLQHQRIKYLGPKEREVYEVVIEDGKLLYKKNGTLLDMMKDSTDSKWIFFLSRLKIIYVGQKKKGTFQHSSFLAGGATSAAGRLEVQDGILKLDEHYSGLAAISSSIGLSPAPLLEFSIALGDKELSFGAEMGFDSASASFTKYNAGIGLNKPDFSASLLLG